MFALGNGSARLMHYAFLDRLDRLVRLFEEGLWIHSHINHQEQQRSDQSDLAPGELHVRNEALRQLRIADIWRLLGRPRFREASADGPAVRYLW